MSSTNLTDDKHLYYVKGQVSIHLFKFFWQFGSSRRRTLLRTVQLYIPVCPQDIWSIPPRQRSVCLCTFYLFVLQPSDPAIPCRTASLWSLTLVANVGSTFLQWNLHTVIFWWSDFKNLMTRFEWCWEHKRVKMWYASKIAKYYH